MTKCWCSTDSHDTNPSWQYIVYWLILSWLYLYDWAYNPSILLHCAVAWIQHDSSGCQQDFLLSVNEICWTYFEVFARIVFWDVRGGIALRKSLNCKSKYIKCSKQFHFESTENQAKPIAKSGHYATGCFVAFLDDIFYQNMYI